MRIDNSFFAANRLGQTLTPTPINQGEEENEKKGIAGGFEKIFDDLWKASGEASAASRENTAKLLTGTLEDFPEYMVTGEKSSILFEYNLTVRTKVIEAYNDILKTSV